MVDEDVRLMLAFRDGDERAFDALFERWAGRVLRFVERMVGEPSVAEDLVQETFVRVWRARERYQPEARFSTWLFTIAGNAARNELRRPFRRAPHDSVDAERDGGPLELAADDAPARRARGRAPHRARGSRPASPRCPSASARRSGCARWKGSPMPRSPWRSRPREKSVKALIHRARVALARDPEGTR